jgi:hypothetical protein
MLSGSHGLYTIGELHDVSLWWEERYMLRMLWNSTRVLLGDDDIEG